MSDTDNHERQIAELALLESMYPGEFSYKTSPDSASVQSDASIHDIEAAIKFDDSYTLEMTLPPQYPASCKPRVYLSCGGDVSTAARKAARSELKRVVEEAELGMECLDVIVSSFAEYLPVLKDSLDDHTRSDSDRKQHPKLAPSRIKRCVIWSHHLLATSKRRSIVTWSKELRLGGYSRPGYPGAVFIEGEEEEVDEFVRRLKELRWQALQVRDSKFADRRVCGQGDGVVEVEGLGDIAEVLKSKGDGCAEMFLEGMRIGTAG